MCRYMCCGCCNRYAHKVLGFELIRKTDTTCCYIKITVTKPTAKNKEFFCVRFNAIPVGYSSFPLRIVINEEETPVVNRKGREITSADLCRGLLLSGRYFDKPELVVC